MDAIYGPSELFVFGVDKIITKFELAYPSQESPESVNSARSTRCDLEASSFRWIDRKRCLDDLGRITVEVFQDACLLAGSSLLKQFPPLCNPAKFPNGYTLRDVVNLILANGRSVVRLCSHYSTDPLVQELQYLDRYKRTMTGIRYHPIITSEGDIDVVDKDRAPDDLHACVGYRLPEELNMYLSRGMIRPEFLEALNSGTVRVAAPFDGGDSPVYQRLVKTQLRPVREATFALLASSLHHYYKNARTISTRFWFEPQKEQRITIKNILPFDEALLSQWNVRGDVIVEQRRKLEVGTPPSIFCYHSYLREAIKASSESLVPGSLSYAILSLADTSFAQSTITYKSKDEDKASFT